MGAPGSSAARATTRASPSEIGQALELDASALRRSDRATRSAGRARRGASTRPSMRCSKSGSEPPLDVVLVTHSRDEGAEAATTTTEILRRIFDARDDSFDADDRRQRERRSRTGRRSRKRSSGRANAALVPARPERPLGPSDEHRAWPAARSEYVVYVCSKEGFALRPAGSARTSRSCARIVTWRSPGIRSARRRSRRQGQYVRATVVQGFRNKQFAEDNPDREFFHVQGGLFGSAGARSRAAASSAPSSPQEAVDVEYSYYVESLGLEARSRAGRSRR